MSSVGARPKFMKVAPLLGAIAKLNKLHESRSISMSLPLSQ
ncbi:MAG: hypothetical protein ACOC6R_02110 [Chloroflexota bacterium]